MKTVLLSIDIYRTIHKYIVNVIENSLVGKFIIHKIYTGKTANIYPSTDISNNVKYDCIICINGNSYKYLRKKGIDISNTPIIYIYCAKDSFKEFPYCYSRFTEILCIQDGTNTFSLNYSFIKKIRIPLLSNNNNVNCRNIIIGGDDSLLVRISKTINTIDALFDNLIVISNTNIVRRFLNKNIVHINGVRNDISEQLLNAKVVIGSGDIIARAVSMGISSIVVGEEGYGGVITETNFNFFHRTGFNGRVGGSYFEYIPEDLIIAELKDFLNTGSDSLKEITKGININSYTAFRDDIRALMDLTIERYNVIDYGQYLRNDDFDIFPIGDGLHIVKDRVCGINLFLLDEIEYEIIKSFDKPVSIASLSLHYNTMNFFVNLISNKIILPYDE